MLIPKIEQRITQYLDFLERNAYRKLADLEFEAFETGETFRLPPENAEWKKIPSPAPWGSEWKCTWFRAVYRAPLRDISFMARYTGEGESANPEKRPVFLSVTPNADSLAFIDGKPAGAFNIYHNKIRIEADGREHVLHVEAYAGHLHGGCGPFEGASIVVNIGKTLPAFPNTFGGGCLLERLEAVHALFYDIRALYETAKIAGANSLRRARILKGLYDAITGISFNASGEELERQAAAAARKTAPLLALKNGPTTPAVHLIGHAHIDHAWLWHIGETERKTARTFANMARFAKEYPEFVFIQSQPCQLEIVKNEYPEVFEAVKEAYQNGNWEPNGGMWVEADCNIPSGESLIRQFLVGKKVNKELLGHEADTLWLPDVFGYSAALPQILKGCRIKHFVTSKISWNDTTQFPYETFIWRGIDGTPVTAHLIPGTYNSRVAPEQLAEMWNKVQHKEAQSGCVMSIGEGDGGGGTLRADLEMARRLGDLEGAPRAAWKTVSAALDDIFNGSDALPEWRGELYLELHRGTYTTQARTKRNNRLLEFALRNAEFLCAFAAAGGNAAGSLGEYPHAALLESWKPTLTHQFHDIIPGSSIGRVYAEAEAVSARILSRLADISAEAKTKILAHNEGAAAAGKGRAAVVFNDLSWERSSAVRVPAAQAANTAALRGANGSVYPIQRYTDLDGIAQAVFAPGAPSLGWARLAAVSDTAPANTSPFNWRNGNLETPFYLIKFNAAGRIISLIDRRQNREMVAPGGAFNAFVSAEDVPVFWDAWDIDADWEAHSKAETRLQSTEVAADGPVCFRLRRAYDIGAASHLVQDMVCYANDPRIDFETKVSWNEKWRLLKVQFDTAIDAAQVRCEIQYGHIMRNTHRNLMQDRAKFEICAHKWISLEEEGGGIALLNDCKYGHDVLGGTMRLSLLRSPIAPDPDADRGEHRFTYAILPFSGGFGASGVIRSAYELNSPATAEFTGDPAGGGAANPESQSLCAVEGCSVIVESVKAPENGSANALIIRLYESLGGRSKTTLRFCRKFRSASETDMLEDNPRQLAADDSELSLEFKPFEIKTIRLDF
jgi:alpha-mannosidase